ncbi:hypothetical protein [Candidatus Ichthyocystis hellenicum]|uniref:hypothetical protein n=1 Tax=Candidatus Ichthyocystis hellenicum TaxID=1561003 RepID=UPI000B86A634|nr:hypothetical protein [Candidatus Ichthyocystis hellenicum]
MRISFIAVLIVSFFASFAQSESLSYAWIEVVPGTDRPLELRAVVNKTQRCPITTVDDNKRTMVARRVFFSHKLCYLSLRGTENVVMGSYHWRLKEVNRVLVVPSWADVSVKDRRNLVMLAQHQKPDLVVFMGDYVAPKELNLGWKSWTRNFLDEWQMLFSSVPVLFARGRYEDCRPAAYDLWHILLRPIMSSFKCSRGSGTWFARWSNFYALVLDDAIVSDHYGGGRKLLADVERHHGPTLNPHPWVISPHPIFCEQSVFKNVPTCKDDKLRLYLESWLIRHTSLVIAKDEYVSRMEHFDGLPLQAVLGRRNYYLSPVDFSPEGIKDVDTNKVYASPEASLAVFDYHDHLVKNSHWDMRWFDQALNILETCFLEVRKVNCSGKFSYKIFPQKKH